MVNKKIMTLEEAISSHPNIWARKVIWEGLETDELTGVLNRRGFEKRLKRAIKRADRHNMPFTYGFVDLHNLKAYNEISHRAGDAAIKQLASTLIEFAREDDAVGRMGAKSDEFSLIVSGLTKDKHHEYLERMRAIVRLSPKILESVPFLAYWGLAQYSGQSIEELHDEADKKMNREKTLVKALSENSEL